MLIPFHSLPSATILRLVCRWGSFLRPVDLAWISRAQEYHQRFLTDANTLTKATATAGAGTGVTGTSGSAATTTTGGGIAFGIGGGSGGGVLLLSNNQDHDKKEEKLATAPMLPQRSSRRNAGKTTTTNINTTTTSSSSYSGAPERGVVSTSGSSSGSGGDGEDGFNVDPAVVTAAQHSLDVARELRRITDPFLVFHSATGEEVRRGGSTSCRYILSIHPVEYAINTTAKEIRLLTTPSLNFSCHPPINPLTPSLSSPFTITISPLD